MLFSLNIQRNNVFTSYNYSNVLCNAAITADRYSKSYFNKYYNNIQVYVNFGHLSQILFDLF